MMSPSTAVPRLSIVVVNYRTADITCDCLDAVAKHLKACNHEVIVVDNASNDGSVETIRQRHPQVRLLSERSNRGFGGGNNVGVAAAQAPYLLLLNSDALLREDTPSRLVDFLEAHPDVACVGPRIDLLDGTRQAKVYGHSPTPWRAVVQSSGLSRLARVSPLLTGIDAEEPVRPVMQVGWISGVCMAMRTAAYRAVGGFDTRFFMYCEDIDLCMRLGRQGGRIVHLDDSPVTHLGGASSRPIDKRLRNAVWQQRNLLMILRDRHGRLAVALTRAAMVPGQIIRLAVGVARIGDDESYLLRMSWVRMLDLLGLLRRLPG